MKRILIIFLILCCFCLQYRYVFGTSYISEHYTLSKKDPKKRKLKRFARVKARKARVLRRKAMRLANKNGWLIRKECKDGSVHELVGVDKLGRPVYIQSEKIR